MFNLCQVTTLDPSRLEAMLQTCDTSMQNNHHHQFQRNSRTNGSLSHLNEYKNPAIAEYMKHCSYSSRSNVKLTNHFQPYN